MFGTRVAPTTSLGNVAVIGASTSGLHAATLLAESGLAVRVYEARDEFRPQPRTLIVTSRLTDVLGFAPSAAIVNRTHHFELFSPNASSRVSLRKPDLIVERGRLLHILAERARKAGVQIILGRRFVGFGEPSRGANGSIVLRFVDAAGRTVLEESATCVLGADGVHSRLAAEVTGEGARSVALLQAQVSLLIADDAGVARTRLDRFLSAHDLEPLGYQSSAVGVHQFATRYQARKDGTPVYLIGDAAGQVKMTTVGGLVTGLRGARAAVHAILASARGSPEGRNLRQELDLHLLLRRMLDRFNNDDYDVLLKLLNSDLKRVLETRNRDELSGVIWRLPFVQPRLVSLATRALLRRRRDLDSRSAEDRE